MNPDGQAVALDRNGISQKIHKAQAQADLLVVLLNTGDATALKQHTLSTVLLDIEEQLSDVAMILAGEGVTNV